jgi:hypothetical protein
MKIRVPKGLKLINRKHMTITSGEAALLQQALEYAVSDRQFETDEELAFQLLDKLNKNWYK